MRRSFASVYFVLQGLAVAAWWTLLTVEPAARSPFLPPGNHPSALLAFAAPDLSLLAAGSLLTGFLLVRDSGWALPVMWLVAGAVDYATLQVMKDERLVENSAALGSVLTSGLEEIQARNPVIGDIRGKGLMVATEFVRPDGAPNPEAVAKVIQKCQDEKVLLLNCGTFDQAIRIIPPLVVNETQINEFLDVYERAVTSL